MYINFNDYGLLYLIKEGNEKALDYLFYKYRHLIYKIAYEYSNDEMVNDIAQEGYMILYKCINQYNSYLNYSFYSYFVLCYKRRIKRIMDEYDCYTPKIYLNEEWLLYKPENKSFHYYVNKDIEYEYKYDEIVICLYYDCILHNKKLIDFSNEYKINYRLVRYKYSKLIKYLKKIITNYI